MSKAYVCSKCNKVSPHYNPNFCSFCGNKMSIDDLKELPICPSNIKHGHCDDCLKLKAKECDNCHYTNDVKYRPEYDHKCLCYNCRMREATITSMSRSW